ncbi:hypothetical protein evm_007909 [Chilo suppressalis]|nr:hypothetical protein evm_007909 [Chilo suppressalis]
MLPLALLFAAEEERQKKILNMQRRQLREDFKPMLCRLSEWMFVDNFRMGKDKFLKLCEDLMPLLHPTQRSTAIRPELKILATLQYYGSGSYQSSLVNNFNLGLSQTSLSVCLSEVTNAINQPQILKKYVTFPRSSSKRIEVAKSFRDQYGFPGVLGCIDTTHVAIKRPRDNEEAYFNRKLYHSLNVMLICDADLRILYVDASFGGEIDDLYVWNSCPVRDEMQNLHEKGHKFWLLGDSAYEQHPWMMTPFLQPIPGSPEEHYNNKHAHAREAIEKCLNVLKTRFHCLLADRAMHYSPVKAGQIVNACVVLHNLISDSSIEIDKEAMSKDFECQPPSELILTNDKESCTVRQALVESLSSLTSMV